MMQFIETAKGAVALIGTTVAGTSLGMLADVITQDTPISLGGAIGVAAVVIVGAWYLSSRLTKIDDRLDSIESHVSTLPCGEKGEDCPRRNGKK